MTPDAIFQVCSTIAMVGWLIILVASPLWAQYENFITGTLIAILAVVYLSLIIQVFEPDDFARFGTLDGVMELFTNRTAVTAGWIHYLAFDLFIGCWIKKNSLRYGISHWIVIPCLLLTFMLGPVGLLVYIIIRAIVARRYFAENF
jgi:hypothetical protein